MTYVVLLSEQSKKELAVIKKSGDKATIKKIANMLVELQEHPRTGTGVSHSSTSRPIARISAINSRISSLVIFFSYFFNSSSKTRRLMQ